MPLNGRWLTSEQVLEKLRPEVNPSSPDAREANVRDRYSSIFQKSQERVAEIVSLSYILDKR